MVHHQIVLDKHVGLLQVRGNRDFVAIHFEVRVKIPDTARVAIVLAPGIQVPAGPTPTLGVLQERRIDVGTVDVCLAQQVCFVQQDRQRVSLFAMSAADLPDIDPREACELGQKYFTYPMPDKGVAKKLRGGNRNAVDRGLRHRLVMENHGNQLGQVTCTVVALEFLQPALERGPCVAGEVVAVAQLERVKQEVHFDVLDVVVFPFHQRHSVKLR